MSAPLEVTLFGQPAGTLSLAGPLRSPEDWSFAYHADYLRAQAPALSVSMPLRDAPWRGAVARNWFCNLLPEGSVREAIAARLRLPIRDDFALLAAIGGECAGAVSVHPQGAPLFQPKPEAEETDLETLLYLQGDGGGEGRWALVGTPLRLSLAGAQDKLAVVMAADGRLRLPHAGEPSTHILKPDSRRFPGIRDAEAFGLALAQRIGLDAAHAALVEPLGQPALLVTRFDRRHTPGGHAERLHQEDFCQALGYPERMKYESQGGPSLAACASLLRDLALGPAAIQGFLDWVIFNALIGNADAHAKNLALLRTPDGARQLAPFYDLVPTAYLPESLVDRTPAMRIGHAQRIDQVRPEDWATFANEARYRKAYVLARVQTLAAGIRKHLDSVAENLAAQGGNAAQIARIRTTIAQTTAQAACA